MTRPATSQKWDAERYAHEASYVPGLAEDLVALLDPKPGQHILDLGCGEGSLTLKLVERGASVIGIDSSPEMIAKAKAAGLNAKVMDAEDLSFDGEFDGVFSNAALHWMTQPKAVLSGVRKSMKEGATFVGEFGGFGNAASVTAALTAVLASEGVRAENLSPWFFPTAQAYEEMLEDADLR